MKNTEEEFTTLAIEIGVTVAIFFLNTGLTLEAIELCKESFILLSNGDLSADSPVAKSFDERIRTTVKRAWFALSNLPNFEENLRKLEERDENDQKYLEKALDIQIEIGDGKREATNYRNLGIKFLSLRKYDKA